MIKNIEYTIIKVKRGDDLTEKRGRRKRKNFLLKWLERVLPLVLKIFSLSFLLGLISLVYSSMAYGDKQLENIEAYFSNPKIISLNILPIFISIGIIYIVTNSMALGFSLTALVFLGPVIINKIRFSYTTRPLDLHLILDYRDRLKFRNLLNYLDRSILITVLVLAIVSLLLMHKKEKHKLGRLGKLSYIFLLSLIFLSKISYYRSPLKYDSIRPDKETSLISKKDDYMSKGFIYSGLYDLLKSDSKTFCKDKDLESLLKNFSNEKDDLNLDFIIVELDGYGDFSEYNGIDPKIYDGFNLFSEEGIRGDLITADFGSGGVESQKSFLTGYGEGKNRKNSYLEFLRKQAYSLEFLYPGRKADYKKYKNNQYYHFTDSRAYGNGSKAISLGQTILDSYRTRDKAKGYLSYSVSRPLMDYSFNYQGEEQYIYIENPVSPKDYSKLNSYFSRVKEVDQSLKTLYSGLIEEERPVLVILYSSYSPGIGIVNPGNSLDDIFDNYKAPYVVWGNKSLKEVYNKNFDREGLILGPEFLFPYVLDYLDLYGDSFIAYINDLREYFTVNQYRYLKVGDEYISKEDLPSFIEDKYMEYRHIEDCLD